MKRLVCPVEFRYGQLEAASSCSSRTVATTVRCAPSERFRVRDVLSCSRLLLDHHLVQLDSLSPTGLSFLLRPTVELCTSSLRPVEHLRLLITRLARLTLEHKFASRLQIAPGGTVLGHYTPHANHD